MKHMKYMKRVLALVLCLALVLTGCSQSQTADNSGSHSEPVSVPSSKVAEGISEDAADDREDIEPQFNSLDDERLLAYVEDLVYSETVTDLDSEEYFVESVNAVYLSREYLDEVAFNSQSNIYFGYTLSELDELFQGTRYVFTLDENGETTIQELQEIKDTTAETIIKNAAIGSGVILVCVTVSIISAGAGAPAVSMIFAASAVTAANFAESSALFGGFSAGIVRGIQTGDFKEAFKAAALAGSEGFKWGAISGGILGGAGEAFFLKAATKSGLTMNEAAKIQKATKWPVKAIEKIHSMPEYDIYKNANLMPTQLPNGELAFLWEFDWDLVDDFGWTNVERVAHNLAPIDSTGKPFELHHIGQKADAPLAILTYDEHHKSGNYGALHYAKEGKNVASEVWKKQRENFWKTILEMSQGG